MADTVQQIKDKLSIVDVVSGYVKLERSGGSLRARCPFHAERTPSFFVSPDRGTYHCFGCGVGGDIFSFVEGVEGLDFKGALKVLAEKAGVPLVYSRLGRAGGEKDTQDERDRLFALLETATLYYQQHLTEDAKKYLADRGLKPETVNAFRVGWAGKEWSEVSDYLRKKGYRDKELLDSGIAKKNERGQISDKFRNRIMFPIGDSAGRIIGFSGRIFGEDASPEAPKYLNSPETPLFHKSRILYGFDKAKMTMRKLDCAVLVEGQMDLLMSHQSGWSNTVAVSGTAFTAEHAALIKRMTENLVIALDPDEAGIKATGRAARAALASGLNVKVAQLPEGLDPADLIKDKGPDSWKEAIKNAKDIITFLLDVLQAHAKSPDAFRRNVEAAVLPFLTDIQSPIAREQSVREIANRLGVSQGAVQDALQKIPLAPVPTRETEENVVQKVQGSFRARNAYAILVWQESVPKTKLNLKELESELADAIGKDGIDALRALPESEQEHLRFAAERLYGVDRSPREDFRHLTTVLARERLTEELARVTAMLRTAEGRGDSGESQKLLEQSKLLTGQIANLHKME
jgi:DNA primase